jgi:gluconolactonase
MRSLVVLFAAALSLAGQTGGIVAMDSSFSQIVSPQAVIEKLGGGMRFTEGPVWMGDHLLFTDIPANAIMKWSPGGQVVEFKKPIFPGQYADGQFVGANGLTRDKQGRLVACEHGNRRVARWEKNGKITVLADRYEGKRLNSPNDGVFHASGDFYFTDPPYGLAKGDDDPAKELKFNGVFRIRKGKVDLLVDNMTRPNGIAFSPDGKRAYIANSDPERKVWMVFDVAADGKLANGSVFYDVTKESADGLPDGLKVDKQGNIYGTGPGGVWVFSPGGKLLGKIQPPEVPANCAFGDADGKTLYMTARTGLYRVRLNVEGIRP